LDPSSFDATPKDEIAINIFINKIKESQAGKDFSQAESNYQKWLVKNAFSNAKFKSDYELSLSFNSLINQTLPSKKQTSPWINYIESLRVFLREHIPSGLG
jgi:hypothetical protein